MKISIKNRYNFKVIFENIDNSVWSFQCAESICTRIGEDNKNIDFVDPEGGPFIHVGSMLSDFSKSLPECKIIEIKYCDTTNRYLLSVAQYEQ